MPRGRRHLGVALDAGRLAARRLLMTGETPRDIALAESLGERLDDMKGLAMKLGQIVSYMDVPLPEAAQARFEALQEGTRARPFTELRPVIESSLGLSVEAAFESIDPEPVSAASIGQVHRARYGGADVAVKIQYPGIAETFEKDLRSVHRLAGLASLASSVDGRALVRELAERLSEECDYLREARAQSAFAKAFADDPTLRIPRVFVERSGLRVLTTEWIESASFAWYCDESTDEARQRSARALVRFAYRGLLCLGAIQADPHPGNFRFTDDRVACFDFGCVRVLGTDMVEGLRRLTLGAVEGEAGAVKTAALDLGLVGNERRFDHAHFFASMRALYRPFWQSSFEFSAAYTREAMAFNGPSSPNARWLAMPPAYVWVARLQWGLWSVLRRLGARGPLRPTLDEMLARPITPILRGLG